MKTAQDRANEFFDSVYGKGASEGEINSGTLYLLLKEHEEDVRRAALMEAREALIDFAGKAQYEIVLTALCNAADLVGDMAK